MNFREKIESGKFVVTAELFPPKGPDLSKLLSKAELLSEYVDAFNITDNQRAVMRISSLAASAILKERGLEPIYQITCRDRNRLALQSDLLGAAAMGIGNILLLGGDHPRNGDHPEAKPVYDLDTIQLIQTADKLNHGVDMNGKNLNMPTNLFIGAAVNPGADPIEPQLLSFEKKVASGVHFFQSQVIFDIGTFTNFLQKVKDISKNIHILPGIVVVKSFKMAQILASLPGVKMPEAMLKAFETSSDPLGLGMQLAAKLIGQLAQVASGVHIMAIGIEEKIPDLIKLSGVKNNAV